MKQFIVLAATLTFLCCFAASTHAFTCKDGSLAREGMHKYEILSNCGPPVSKEIVGVDEKDGSYRKIEEWLYIVDVYGHKQMYLIRFDEKGIAREIVWLGEQK